MHQLGDSLAEQVCGSFVEVDKADFRETVTNHSVGLDRQMFEKAIVACN
jgi:hypothetical protein